MLRRGRLRLVAAAAAVVLLAVVSCRPAPPVASDRDPAPPSALRAARATLARSPEAAQLEFSALVAQHPDSWAAARGLQDVERLLLPPDEFIALQEGRARSRPDDALSQYLWGRARIEVPSSAREAFVRAQQLDPRSPWPVAGLAHLHRSHGDLFLTVSTYKEGIEQQPHSVLLRALLGGQLMELNLFVEAQRHLEFARELDGEDPHVATALGRTYAALGRHEEAERLLLESFAVDPRQAECARALARLALRTRRVEEAERYDRVALELGLARDAELVAAIRAARVRLGR